MRVLLPSPNTCLQVLRISVHFSLGDCWMQGLNHAFQTGKCSPAICYET